jgi:hypothetical protein
MPLPYGMNACNRRCFRCGVQPQYLGVLASVPEEVEGTYIAKALVIKDCSCLWSPFLALLLVVRNYTRVDTFSGEHVHCCFD